MELINTDKFQTDLYNLGNIYFNQGNKEKALHCYKLSDRVIDSYLKKIECIECIENDKNKIIYDYCMEAYLLSLEDSSIIVDTDVLIKIDQYLTILSFYTKNMKEGLEACNRLLLNKNTTKEIKDKAGSDLYYYINPIKSYNLNNFKMVLPNDYVPLNPSILHYKDNKYFVVIRTVNYTKNKFDQYFIKHHKNIIITRNFLCSCEFINNELQIISKTEINNDYIERVGTEQIHGMEDLRLYEKDNKLYFVCTTPDTYSHEYVSTQISEGYFSFILDELWNSISKEDIISPILTFLPKPNPRRHEKNWIHLPNDNFLYSSNQTIDKNCKIMKIHDYNNDYNSFHGSSVPIPYKNGYLMIIHHVHVDQKGDNTYRKYYHRLILMDTTYKFKKVSLPFYFEDKQIEFCSGLSPLGNDSFLVTFGVNDNQAKYCVITKNTINEMLDIEEEFNKTVIVSTFIDLSKIEPNRRKTAETYKEHCNKFLKLQHPMILFLDSTFIERAKEIRKDIEYHTEIIPINFSHLEKVKYLEKLEHNMNTFKCNKQGISNYAINDKDTAKYMILNNSKYDLVEKAIQLDLFVSCQYAWVDFGVLGATKNFNNIDECLKHKSKGLSIPYIRPNITHLQPDNYFGVNNYYCCAGYLQGTKEDWLKFIERYNYIFDKFINLGYWGNEEAFLGYLMVEETHLFDPYYADYSSIFRNRFKTIEDLNVAYYQIQECKNNDKLIPFAKSTILGLKKANYNLPYELRKIIE